MNELGTKTQVKRALRKEEPSHENIVNDRRRFGAGK